MSVPNRRLHFRHTSCGPGRHASLTAEEEQELGRRIINEDCESSRQRIIDAHRHLVVVIADMYAGRGVRIADLIEVGDHGLRSAAKAFDPAEGARFSMLAHWWIKQAMKRAILDARRHVRISA